MFLCFEIFHIATSTLGQLYWVKFSGLMWMTMREARCTEFLQITPSYTSGGHDLRFMLTVSAICGGVLLTGVTLGPKRVKGASSAGMWARTSSKRSTSSRKVGTTAGEPKRVSPATIRSCVPTVH